jgi:tetratricopeptide (TPR) repeat protein
MRSPSRSRATRLLALPLLLAASTACGNHYGKPDQPASQLAFGVSMAQHGLWSEALFRFHQAERLAPDNPHIQNDLGVAYEAAGDYDKALECYKKGLKLDPNSKELRTNYSHFVEFYQGFKPDKKGTAGVVVISPKPAEHKPPETAPPPAAPLGAPEPNTPQPPPPPPV